MTFSSSALELVRRLCQEAGPTHEQLSHGSPCWFVQLPSGKRGRQFAAFADHHHDDRVAVWLKSELHIQRLLIDDEPEKYFRPPYVGVSGWVGVYMDVQTEEADLRTLIQDAYAAAARKR